jgi:hypothetical protein
MAAVTGQADAGCGADSGTRTMRAAILRRHGGAVDFGRRPAPRRRPGEALIRVTAAPASPLDLLCASGNSYFGTPALPYLPGTQGVGSPWTGFTRQRSATASSPRRSSR